jgi:hypothetical protein
MRRGCRKKVAKSVQCGEPSLVKVVGNFVSGGLFFLAGWIGSRSAGLSIFENAILV